MSLSSGIRLSHYEIRSQIGAGGMGEVYLAQDTKLDRRVALKILPAEVAADRGRMNRFVQEAKAASALNHPNIITIHEIDQADSGYFIATEFIDGQTLREHMQTAPMKLSEVLNVAAQVASALVAAHAAGIVHRDIKPENIMLRHDGIVKVLDFGLAKLTERMPSESVDMEAPTRAAVNTEPGVLMGTVNYMSPEQARGLSVDARTDLWSLGVVLYEIVTGHEPFEGETRNDVISLILQKNPPPLTRYPVEVPAELEWVVNKALLKDREERYQTAKDLLADLRRLKQQLEFQAELGRSAGVEPGGEPPVRANGGRAVASSRQSAIQDRAATSAPEIRSLAVLPLENLSANPEDEYFADGMTDALITTLAQIGALRVISRTSVMRYKGTRKALPEIARELKVEAVIEGTVVRSGSRVRIAAQLIEAATDTHLWGRNYESDVRDVLALQSDVARSIAHEVQIQLTPQEKARLSETRPVDPEAYEAFLKGRHHWYRRSPDALKKALEYLQQAIAKDPTSAMAYAGLADAYNSLGWDLYGILPPEESYPKAKDAAKKALELDPNCAEAHAALGWAATGYDWDWGTAETEFRRAIELKPQYGPVHIWCSHFLRAMGRIEESFQESRRALECDPLGLILNMHMGWHYLYSREYEQAIEQLSKTLELDPGFILARMFLGEAYEYSGLFDEAIAEFEKAVRLSERSPIYVAGLGHAYAVSGRRDAAVQIIDELRNLGRDRYVAARGVAEIYMGLGDKEQTFAWLDKAFQQRNGWLLHLKENPRYDILRTDSRYADLVRRMGLKL
ncbi:MAG: protein kinase [bacterium]